MITLCMQRKWNLWTSYYAGKKPTSKQTNKQTNNGSYHGRMHEAAYLYNDYIQDWRYACLFAPCNSIQTRAKTRNLLSEIEIYRLPLLLLFAISSSFGSTHSVQCISLNWIDWNMLCHHGWSDSFCGQFLCILWTFSDWGKWDAYSEHQLQKKKTTSRVWNEMNIRFVFRIRFTVALNGALHVCFCVLSYYLCSLLSNTFWYGCFFFLNELRTCIHNYVSYEPINEWLHACFHHSLWRMSIRRE